MDVGLHEDDELDDINEKPVAKVKSVEELRSHTIDENLNDFSKSIILLKSNYEVQMIVGIKMIPFLLKNDKSLCVHNVFPQLKETCFLDDTNRTLEFYETINSSLLEILSSQLLSHKEFNNHFVELISNKIYNLSEKPSDYEISAILQIWCELMFSIVDLLPETLIKTTIFDFIPNIKLHNASKSTREYLSVLLAKCASKLNHSTVKNQLYPILLDLCNDTQYEVRASACKSLSTVCKVVGEEFTTAVIIPEMFKYLCDESTMVKTECFHSLVEILEIFTDYDTKNYLLKKIQSIIEYGLQIKDELYLLKISESLGTIITSLNDTMTSQSKLFFIDVFYQICKNENLFTKRSINESKYNWLTCKINLANCFPSILLIANSTSFENKLAPCLTSLIKDKNEKVRVAIVSKLIEITQKLGPLQHHLLINDFSISLGDKSALVQNEAINNISCFLKLFMKNDTNGILNETQQMPGYQLVLDRLIQLEKSMSETYKYTLHSQVLASFSILPWLICTDLLVDKILPILETRLNARAIPVRVASIQSMLIILRKIPRSNVRFYFYNKLIDFSMDKNCYKRGFFVEICKMVMQYYSKSFFKANFYQPLLKLAKDPVVNVRISFIKIMADLKKIWKLQSDREKLEHLEVLARGFFHDKDKDVFELAQKAILQMDQIKSYLNNEAENKINRIKEEEENFLMEMEPRKQMPKNGKTEPPNGNSTKARTPTKMIKSINNKLQQQQQMQQLQSHSQPQFSQPSQPEMNTRNSQNHIEEYKKRSQTINLTSNIDRPKARPLQIRRSSINAEIFSGSSSINPINGRQASIKKK